MSKLKFVLSSNIGVIALNETVKKLFKLPLSFGL